MLTDQTAAEIIRMQALPLQRTPQKPKVKVRPRKRPTVHAAGSRRSIALVRGFAAQEQRRRTRAAAERELLAALEARWQGVSKRRAAW